MYNGNQAQQQQDVAAGQPTQIAYQPLPTGYNRPYFPAGAPAAGPMPPHFGGPGPNMPAPLQQPFMENAEQVSLIKAGLACNPGPVSPPPTRERFTYTRYQLALLLGIFAECRYPSAKQKMCIAKRLGITRDQVKIWFQNRRRKEVVAAQKGTPVPPVAKLTDASEIARADRDLKLILEEVKTMDADKGKKRRKSPVSEPEPAPLAGKRRRSDESVSSSQASPGEVEEPEAKRRQVEIPAEIPNELAQPAFPINMGYNSAPLSPSYFYSYPQMPQFFAPPFTPNIPTQQDDSN